MSESRAHRRAKYVSAGPGGYVEVPLGDGRRLDALSRDGVWATEVERSGDFGGLWRAVMRLVASGAPQKVLKVPQQDMNFAAVVLRKAGVSAWVRNMDGSDEFFVQV